MANIVLVHGSFHDGRCWDRVRPLLEAQGHQVAVVNFTGQCGGSLKHGYRVSMHDYAVDIIDVAERCGKPVIAVGHSMGGIAISAAAQKRPELFRHLVYLTALVPAGKASAASAGSGDKGTSLSGAFSISLLTGRVSVKPDRGAELFYGDCSQEDQLAASAFVQPQPLRPLLSRINFTDDRLGTVSKSYIECLGDKAISIQHQREMQTRQTFQQVVTLEGSHSPFWAQPEALSKIIEEVAAH